MRPSLNDMQLIEEFLSSAITPENGLLLQAKTLLDPAFTEKIDQQRKIYQLIHEYGRMVARAEIKEAERKAFDEEINPGFRERVLQLFSRK